MNTEYFNNSGSDHESDYGQQHENSLPLTSGRHRIVFNSHPPSGQDSNLSHFNSSKFRNRQSTFDVINFSGVNCKIQDGILVFESFDSFEQIEVLEMTNRTPEFVDYLRRSKSFVSYNDAHLTASELDIIGDLVNFDGILKIDDFILKLDFGSRLVYAATNVSPRDLRFVSPDNLQADMEIYDMDVDVISELRGKKSRGLKLFCKEKYAWTGKIMDGIDGIKPIYYYAEPLFGNTNGVPSKIDAYEFWQVNVNYKSWGVWFKMWSECFAGPYSYGQYWGKGPIDMKTNFTCKRRCGKSFSGSNLIDHVLASGTNAKRQVYSSIRALTTYWIEATIAVDPLRVVPWQGNSKTVSMSS